MTTQAKSSFEGASEVLTKRSSAGAIMRKPLPNAIGQSTPDLGTFTDSPTSGSIAPLRSSQLTTIYPPPKEKRQGWLSALVKGSKKSTQAPDAWILGPSEQTPYDLTPLLKGQKVREIWDDQGKTLVYLFPPTSGNGPSFRLPSRIYRASNVLRRAGRSDSMPIGSGSTSSLGSGDRSRSSDCEEDGLTHIHLPIAFSTPLAHPLSLKKGRQYPQSDIDLLVAVRNTFAFLEGAALVATEQRPCPYSIFLAVSQVLEHMDFSNEDGSTLGELVSFRFNDYVEKLHLADVRNNCEKVIEALHLGERMRSQTLYNEAFVHGAGMYKDIREFKGIKFQLISKVTLSRLERASMDLSTRQKNIEAQILDFDFQSILHGILNSKTDDGRKIVSFDTWKHAFQSTRKFFLSYYKAKYGSWPPKGPSKKNSQESNKLNRIVLRDLYQDVSTVYDLLVNRKSTAMGEPDERKDGRTNRIDGVYAVLRRVLTEYDTSYPPVKPTIPYDVPILPRLPSARKEHGTASAAKVPKALRKKIKEHEFVDVLSKSINQDANRPTPFLDAFKAFEQKSLHKKSIVEIWDIRCGQWIFLYAVLQCLPMLVVDAPDVRWTHGVEYFLCEPPRSGLPWAPEVNAGRERSWYCGADGGLVALPSNVIEHSIEGVYRRSHCWEMAAKWSNRSGLQPSGVDRVMDKPLLGAPHENLLHADKRFGPSHEHIHSNRSSVVGSAPEPVQVPHASSRSHLRAGSTPTVDSNITFDSILGTK